MFSHRLSNSLNACRVSMQASRRRWYIRAAILLVVLAVLTIVPWTLAVASDDNRSRVCVSSATAELIEGRLVETHNGIDCPDP